MLQEPAAGVTILQNSLLHTILKDGDTVFVRIVEDTGNGTYTASFAGNRFLVRSLQPLSIGSSFKAQIHLENSLLKITPFVESSLEPISNQTVSDFLNRIGLPPDAISLRLVQFFQQSSLKINIQLAQKARSIAASFHGREKDAAEAVLFLSDKGIESTEEMVASLLNQVRNESKTNEADNALLSYVNHKKGSNRHWILLPFSDKNPVVLKGIVKILVNTEIKKTEKIVINCKTPVKKFFFMLQLQELVTVQSKRVLTYCTEPCLDGESRQMYSDQLEILLGKGEVTDIHYQQSLIDDGLFSQNLDVGFFQGSV